MKNCIVPALVAIVVFGSSMSVFAQGPDGQDGPPQGGPPPGFGGPGGRGGFGGGPMGGPFGGPRELTVATVPMDALTHYLKLTSAQQQKIESIHEAIRSSMPRPSASPQDGGDGGPPPRPSEADMKKMQAAQSKANQQIMAVLTTEQKQKLSPLMKAFAALRADHISLRAAAKLDLTTTQIKKLASAGKSATHESVVSDFTATQNEIADQNRRQGGPGGGRPGGPDGMGGPGGGPGEGGPPPGGPDGDGPGGPPPGE